MTSNEFLTYIYENAAMIKSIHAQLIYYRTMDIINDPFHNAALSHPLYYVKVNFIDPSFSHQTITSSEYAGYTDSIVALKKNKNIIFPIIESRTSGVVGTTPFTLMNKQLIDPKFVELILMDCKGHPYTMQLKAVINGNEITSWKHNFPASDSECLRNLNSVLFVMADKGYTISAIVPA